MDRSTQTVWVQRGRSPSCSSAGSVVGLALMSAAATAVVVNAFADRLLARLRDDPDDPPPSRREADGAIVAIDDPPALLRVDGDTADALDAPHKAPPVDGALSAPTEVHLAVTGRCPVRCKTCYVSAGPDVDTDDPDDLVECLDELAAAGVFEVALGGGEAIANPSLVAIARHARAVGLVPNVTTSGVGLDHQTAGALAEICGQINVSLDGLGPAYRAVRGFDGSARALAAIDMLLAAGATVGVNTVLTGRNVGQLDALAAALRARGVRDWQWIRLKPSGRGRDVYEALRLSASQALELWPRALALSDDDLQIRFDCALVPFIAAHEPPVDSLVKLAVSGCTGGQRMLARSPTGQWAPCSFAGGGSDGPLLDAWRDDPQLLTWRARAASPPAPCATCPYQQVCRGGCRIVAAHAGDAMAPDPECPRVAAWAA